MVMVVLKAAFGCFAFRTGPYIPKGSQIYTLSITSKQERICSYIDNIKDRKMIILHFKLMFLTEQYQSSTPSTDIYFKILIL